jgi:hypothetical protein
LYDGEGTAASVAKQRQLIRPGIPFFHQFIFSFPFYNQRLNSSLALLVIHLLLAAPLSRVRTFAMDAFLKYVPQPLQLILAGAGALYLGFKTVSFVQLILSAFVLSGTSVSIVGILHRAQPL